MEHIAKLIIFKGRVQGIGFRFTVLNIANRYKLTGTVRNLFGGSVEMLAQGPQNDIEDCINDIKKSFPDYITETRIEETPFDPQYKDFKITF